VTQALSHASDEVSAAPPIEAEWLRLEQLSNGSVRSALTLHASGGLALYDKVLGHLSDLPKVDWPAVHGSSDELASPVAEQRFELFYGLLLGLLARLVHAAATGTGDAREVALAQRLIGSQRLAAFAEVWETVVADKAQTLALNLDRRSLILETFSRLEAAARH
jgi:DNA polymerase-3 subunit delta'